MHSSSNNTAYKVQYICNVTHAYILPALQIACSYEQYCDDRQVILDLKSANKYCIIIIINQFSVIERRTKQHLDNSVRFVVVTTHIKFCQLLSNGRMNRPECIMCCHQSQFTQNHGYAVYVEMRKPKYCTGPCTHLGGRK